MYLFLFDASRHSATPEFDAVFSNAALHWMKQPSQWIADYVRLRFSAGKPSRFSSGF
jgi:trans-aconitate methyltransferase